MKRKTLCIFLSVILIFGMFSMTTLAADTPTYSGGTGTESDPYLLATPEDLIALKDFCLSGGADTMDRAVDENGDPCACGLGGYHGYHFKLVKDIDMTGKEWTPFNFCGIFDGDGHTISNMQMYENYFSSADPGSTYSDDQYEASFFSQLVNATVKDIYFKNCKAKISSNLDPASTRDIYVAIVAGTAIASSFENCCVINSVVEQNGKPDNFGYAAGIVAVADTCHFSNCSVQEGSISSGGDATDMYVGGIVGAVLSDFSYYITNYNNPYNMKIGNGNPFGVYNSFCTTDIVTNSRYSVGGIVGWTISDWLDDVYENCYMTGNINSAGRAGGIIGEGDSYITLKNCAVLSETIKAGDSSSWNADYFIGTAYTQKYLKDVQNCKVSDKTTLAGGTTSNIVGATPDSAVTENAVRISNFYSNLYGTLADKAEGVEVKLYEKDILIDAAKTDKDGYFNFGKDLLPGEYTVKIDESTVVSAFKKDVTIPYATNVELDIERTYKEADYSAVDAAIEKANKLNKDDYKDFSGVEAAINAVVRDKKANEQDAVDAMAKAIEDAIAALEKKSVESTQPTAPTTSGTTTTDTTPKVPATGDASMIWIWFTVMAIAGVVVCGAVVYDKKKR